MSPLEKELEHFDKVALWAYIESRRYNNREIILWVVEGGNA